MAICPFLSYKQDRVDLATRDVFGRVFDDTGAEIGSGHDWSSFPGWNRTTNDAIYLPEQMYPSGSAKDVIVYLTGSGGAGQFDSTGTFHCYQSSECQLWDDINDRCGARSSDFIRNTATVESDAVVNLIKGVVGDYSERDNSNSIVAWLQEILGTMSERDSGSSILTFMKNMLGISSERDSSRSLITYLREVVGDSTDSPENSFIKEFANVVGVTSEIDATSSMTAWLQRVFGLISERDEGKSFITWAQDIIGKTSDLDLNPLHYIGSLLKTDTHIHDGHYHGNIDPHVHYPPVPSMEAMILIAEFMGNQDLDGDKGPFPSPPGWGSVFGKDFMVTDNDDCPAALKAIYDHTDWTDPSYSVTWATYQSW